MSAFLRELERFWIQGAESSGRSDKCKCIGEADVKGHTDGKAHVISKPNKILQFLEY